jgi:hypothetical protein
MKTKSNTRNSECILFCLCFLCFGHICYGQVDEPLINKEQALKNNRVASINGWKEIISDKWRFRIIFPKAPTFEEDGYAVKGMESYRLIDNEMNWAVSVMDFDHSTNDEEQLRKAYKESITAMSGTDSTILKQNEVRANGRLGIEFVLQDKKGTHYQYLRQIR